MRGAGSGVGASTAHRHHSPGHPTTRNHPIGRCRPRPRVRRPPYGRTVNVAGLPLSESGVPATWGGAVAVIALLVPVVLLLMLFELPALEDSLFPPQDQAGPERSDG